MTPLARIRPEDVALADYVDSLTDAPDPLPEVVSMRRSCARGEVVRVALLLAAVVVATAALWMAVAP